MKRYLYFYLIGINGYRRFFGQMRYTYIIFLSGFISAQVQAQCTGSCPSGPNLVVNGDFSAGNTGFSSNYNLLNNASWPMNYCITNDVSVNPGGSTPCADHTTGSGNYMYVDGSNTTIGTIIWKETVAVTPNTNYYFSFWFCNTNPNSFDRPGGVQSVINGSNVGGGQLAGPPAIGFCQWLQHCVPWNSGSSTTAILEITNDSAFFGGNDFGFDDITFVAAGGPVPTISAVQPTCSSPVGSVTATVTGGSAPYTYQWSPSGGNSSAATGLSVGTYTVTVTDASACSSQSIITMSLPASLNSTVSSTPASCGGNNGSASINVSGGVGPYTYNWNPSAQSTQTASNLTAGNYSVMVTDVNGCTTVNGVTIASTLSITATAGPNSTICAGQTVSISSSGGTNYLWSSGQTTASVSVSPVITTTYSVIVTSGTCADTVSVKVTVKPTPAVSISGNTTICTGGSTILTALGGTNYVWSTGNSTASVNISPTGTTSYTVTTTNGLCSSAISITVVVTPPPTSSVANAIICAGQVATLTASGVGTYSWNNGSTDNPIFVSPSITTNYSVVVSIGTCTATAAAMVTVNPSPIASAWSNVTITAGNSATLSASGGGTYLWSNGGNTSAITVSPLITTLYCVTVSNGNCTDTACVTVFVEPIDCSGAESSDAFVLPNAFSPNADGVNENFHLLYGPLLKDCVKEIYIAVYNRWGEMVFEGTALNFSWDGSYKNKLEDTATFAWYMNAVLTTGAVVKKKGNISVLK